MFACWQLYVRVLQSPISNLLTDNVAETALMLVLMAGWSSQLEGIPSYEPIYEPSLYNYSRKLNFQFSSYFFTIFKALGIL